LFSRPEAIIACIVNAFAKHQIAVGELINISEKVRSALIASEGNDRVLIQKRGAIIEAAISGDPSWLLVYESWKEDISEIDEPVDLQTTYSVTAVKAGKAMRVPQHLQHPDGFAVVICLARYLGGLDRYAAD
jgi:hypothetical protein